MTYRQRIYLLGWMLMLSFISASLATGELLYLVGNSACIPLFGIGRAKKRSPLGSLPYGFQLAVACYLSGLALYCWLNPNFVRNESLLSFVLTLLPFVPLILLDERSIFRDLRDGK